jgi:hypothetical protein
MFDCLALCEQPYSYVIYIICMYTTDAVSATGPGQDETRSTYWSGVVGSSPRRSKVCPPAATRKGGIFSPLHATPGLAMDAIHSTRSPLLLTSTTPCTSALAHRCQCQCVMCPVRLQLHTTVSNKRRTICVLTVPYCSCCCGNNGPYRKIVAVSKRKKVTRKVKLHVSAVSRSPYDGSSIADRLPYVLRLRTDESVVQRTTL